MLFLVCMSHQTHFMKKSKNSLRQNQIERQAVHTAMVLPDSFVSDGDEPPLLTSFASHHRQPAAEDCEQDAPEFGARCDSGLSDAATESGSDSPIPFSHIPNAATPSSDARNVDWESCVCWPLPSLESLCEALKKAHQERQENEQVRSPTPEDVRSNTMFNAKREREPQVEADVAEPARTKQRLHRNMYVRFGASVRVRVLYEEDEQRHQAGSCSQHHEPAQPAEDREVETKQGDGPNLISQVVSNLLIGIAQQKLRNAETIMWTVHTTLLNCGWTTVTRQLELDLLGKTYNKIDAMEGALAENGFVAVLPGTIRLDTPMRPWLQQLKLGIHQAALRIARVHVPPKHAISNMLHRVSDIKIAP